MPRHIVISNDLHSKEPQQCWDFDDVATANVFAAGLQVYAIDKNISVIQSGQPLQSLNQIAMTPSCPEWRDPGWPISAKPKANRDDQAKAMAPVVEIRPPCPKCWTHDNVLASGNWNYYCSHCTHRWTAKPT